MGKKTPTVMKALEDSGLSQKFVCQHLLVSRMTLYRWKKKNEIPHKREEMLFWKMIEERKVAKCPEKE
jgi:predicted site-specific integrase-resolvase